MDEPLVTTATHVDPTPPGETVDAVPPRVDGPILRPGSRVGRYQIDAHIGAGGMGRVYAAHDPDLERQVALKLLRAERDDAQGRERLLREARALAKISHPHVVAVHDVGTVGDQVFVAMEHVRGTTLTRALAGRRRGWQEALELLLPAARGLAAVHAAGLVHRDVKPDNIMLGDDGRVRVMDFGLARAPLQAEEAEEEPVTSLDDAPGSSLTRTGAVLGTPPYMAPEQWRGLSADARSDQFAFCVTAWQVLYGERPFAAQGLGPLERAITEGIISTPAREAEVPRWLRRALERGLAVDPAQRHPGMDALIEVLEQGLRRHRARWLALAVAVAVTVVVGIVVGTTIGRVDPGPVLPEHRTLCEADEVCARGPFAVAVCTGADGNPVSEGRSCTPGSDGGCPPREACVTLGGPEGTVGKCKPVCEIVDDRPACVPGCFNQQCAGSLELCARDRGICRPVPCATDLDCEAVATCDFPSRGSPALRCSVEAGFCERSSQPAP